MRNYIKLVITFILVICFELSSGIAICKDASDVETKKTSSSVEKEESSKKDKTVKNTSEKNEKSEKADKTEKDVKESDRKESESEEADEDEDEESEDESDEVDEIDCKNYDVILDEMIEENIYPSFILYTMMDKELRDLSYIHVCVEELAHVKVTISANEFMNECISEHDMTPEDEKFYSPTISWKHKGLLDAEQPGFLTLSVVVEVDGKVKNRFNKVLNYRSVNEAILGLEDEKGYKDFSALFACYVNENSPKIDELLGKILETDRNKSFIGYQGESDDDVLEQVKFIWDYFAKRGTRYSSISGTTNNSQKVYTQYVRFFDQVINNNQANCIDGTCMLASIYKKIGLDVGIVLVPGHAFLAVNGQDVDEESGGVTTYFIETTLMGTKDATFEDAAAEGLREYEENMEKNEDEVFLVDIAQCRELGIMPIGK